MQHNDAICSKAPAGNSTGSVCVCVCVSGQLSKLQHLLEGLIFSAFQRWVNSRYFWHPSSGQRSLPSQPASYAARRLATRLSDIDVRFWTRSKKLARASVTMGLINGTGHVLSSFTVMGFIVGRRSRLTRSRLKGKF